MSHIEELQLEVARLHNLGAMHIRRGFRLSDATPELAANHLLEEGVELQAEIMNGDRQAMLAEASDLLAVLTHLLHMLEIPIENVAAAALAGLSKNFTLSPDAVTASRPGFTRSGRS